MNLTDEFLPIRQWAIQRGLYEKGDVKTQIVKLTEEFGELSQSVLKNKPEEFIDAVGDMAVVLTNLTELGRKYFRENCKSCHGAGYHMENVAGDGGSRMQIDCETCYVPPIEECINISFRVIAKRSGSMIGGTFVKDK